MVKLQCIHTLVKQASKLQKQALVFQDQYQWPVRKAPLFFPLGQKDSFWGVALSPSSSHRGENLVESRQFLAEQEKPHSSP